MDPSTHRVLFEPTRFTTIQRRRGALGVAHDHVQSVRAGQRALCLPRLLDVCVAHPASRTEPLRVAGAAQVAPETAVEGGARRVAEGGCSDRENASSIVVVATCRFALEFVGRT